MKLDRVVRSLSIEHNTCMCVGGEDRGDACVCGWDMRVDVGNAEKVDEGERESDVLCGGRKCEDIFNKKTLVRSDDS